MGELADPQPGDRCYVHYAKAMSMWRASPRWTTIDLIFSGLFPNPDQRAELLALLVFFNLHGMKYEEEKRAENGDI